MKSGLGEGGGSGSGRGGAGGLGGSLGLGGSKKKKGGAVGSSGHGNAGGSGANRQGARSSGSPDSTNPNHNGGGGGEDGDGGVPTVCTNCQTRNTPLWRRDPEGQPLCECFVFPTVSFFLSFVFRFFSFVSFPFYSSCLFFGEGKGRKGRTLFKN